MMSNSPFTAGASDDLIPQGDAARQAVDSLRGYAYQVLASALAWIDIDEKDRVFFEVAEDYTLVAEQALTMEAVQVKDTAGSGSVTLNSSNIRDAIVSFVDLVKRNPGVTLSFRYLTTSPVGTEQAVRDRPGGIAGLDYWRSAAAGADPTPLRQLLESDGFPQPVQEYVRSRDDARLRTDLLQRIRWDCGQPGFGNLREELEERLIVVGRDRFGLPAADARRLADVLAFHVLTKSVLKDPTKRVLKKFELYEILGKAAEISLPRTALAAMLAQTVSGFTGGFAGTGDLTTVVTASDPGWMIASRTLPPPGRFIARPAVQEAVSTALGNFGAAILIGASGFGKSHVARVAAEARADGFLVIDFRDVDAAEARQRLDIAFGRIGGTDASVIIFEDLNHIDEPQVSRSLGRLMYALRRRDRVGLVTCYRTPSPRTLTVAGLDPAGAVECPYFAEEETRELVTLYGGDAGLWGRLAHVTGAWGHPQLCHAFVFGLAGRGWPRSELRDIVGRGLTSEDVDAERESARRSLIGSLPEHARSLLYRLSLLIGRFSRATALALAETRPPVAQAGEALDLLVGPWIEAVAADRYRVSPLASGTGRSMLSPGEHERLHASIAARMLAARTVNASDIDAIVTHALVGKEDSVLFRLSMSLINLADDKLALIAENTTILGIIEPETAFEVDRTLIAIMLRMAQFKLLNAGTDKAKAASAALAAMNLVPRLKDEESKTLFEIMILSTVLVTLNVADYFDDWLAWLQRWRQVTARSGDFYEIRGGFDEAAKAHGATPYAMFFGVGTARITTIARLEKIIDDLAALSAADRELYLTPIEKSMADYTQLINGPWANRYEQPDFDAADAAARYLSIAEKTKDWGIPALAAQPLIARAIMLDEFLGDADAALTALNDAVRDLGESVLLARARAKIFFRRGEYPKTLDILRGIADIVGRENPIERAFALREAAISAGRCDDWRQAEAWFRDAQAAASEVQIDSMKAMAIGLCADVAAAALRHGQTAAALRGLAEALTALAAIDPELSLETAYLHRVVRHTVLWAKAVIEGADVQIGGQPIDVPPGTCSNPDPIDAVRQLPLSDIDTAWYTLAEAEIAAGIDAGITTTLHGRLTGAPIVVCEMMMHNQKIKRAIQTIDAAKFAGILLDFVSANLYVNEKLPELRETFNPITPPRAHIPPGDLTTNLAEQMACDAVLAFGVRALFDGHPTALAALQAELQKVFGAAHLGHSVFEKAAPGSSPDLTQTVKMMLDAYSNGSISTPEDIWHLGFRLFEQLSISNFGSMLFPSCAEWLRQRWARALREQRFLLRQPLRTVPSIQEALERPSNDKSFVGNLLLATIDAASIRLPPQYLSQLRKAAANNASAA